MEIEVKFKPLTIFLSECLFNCRETEFSFIYVFCGFVVVVVVVLYLPNTNRYTTDTCKTNNSIKHIWQVAREALVLFYMCRFFVKHGLLAQEYH